MVGPDTEPLDDRLIEAVDAVARTRGDDWPLRLGVAAPRISQHYRNRRANLPRALEQLLPFVYLVAWLPRYLPRLRQALSVAGLRVSGLLETQSLVRILDQGCGPGTGTIAALYECEAASAAARRRTVVEVVARDTHDGMREVAQSLVAEMIDRGCWPHLDLRLAVSRGDILEPIDGAFDLIVFGHSVCELYQHRDSACLDLAARQLLSTLESTLGARGVAVLLEPALATFPDAPLRFREHCRSSGWTSVVGPCPAATGPCPQHGWSTFREPYCGSASKPVSWRPTRAGRNLQEFCVEAGLLPRNERPVLRAPAFWSLVVTTREPHARPLMSGTIVRRRARGVNGLVACYLDRDGAEALTLVTSRFVRVDQGAYRPVSLHDLRADCDGAWSALQPADLSALFPGGWP